MKIPELPEERKKEAIDKTNRICQDKIKVLDIKAVNYSQGHPYTIGPRHIRNNTLDANEIRRLEREGLAKCAHPGCIASYDDHIHEWGMFLQLQCDLENKEAADLLYQVRLQVLEPYQIAGIGFVDTPQHFRISKPGTTEPGPDTKSSQEPDH